MTHSFAIILLKSVLIAPVATVAAVAPPGPGDNAPPITLDALTNAPADADASWDELGDGVVVLEFWGTWCAPCVAAIPHINELHEQFHPQGVTFISVTFEEPELIERFVERKPLDTWIGHDMDRSMVEAYGVTSWPTTFVVRDGVIVARTHPTSLTADRLAEYIAGAIDEPDAASSNLAERQAGEDGRPMVQVSFRPGNDLYTLLPQETPIFQVIVREAGDFSASGTSNYGATMIGQSIRSIAAALWNRPSYAIDVDEDLADERFDVIYRIPPQSQSELLPIVRALVAEAMNVRALETAEELDGYTLRVAAGGCRLEPGVGEPKGYGSSSNADGYTITGSSMSIDALVQLLQNMLQAPIENRTDLQGTFFVDLAIPYGATEAVAMLERDWGLRLEPTKIDVDVVRIKRRE